MAQFIFISKVSSHQLLILREGFRKIEALEKYIKLSSIWLEGNGIETIENLDHLSRLKQLYLQQNCIQKM